MRNGPNIAISLRIPAMGLNHPVETPDFAPFFDREFD
jgi:hypothetical protein